MLHPAKAGILAELHELVEAGLLLPEEVTVSLT
jgi:hypothetical protein